MKPNGNLILGIVITVISVYYWLTYGTQHGMRGIPVYFALTYRLFPGAGLLWTVAGLVPLGKGVMQMMNERE